MGCLRGRGLPPPHPAEQSAAREDQARKACTGDGAGDGDRRKCNGTVIKNTNPGSFSKPEKLPAAPTDSPKLQHVTAGLVFKLPNDTKKALVITPAETVKVLIAGFPTYSPIPNPAVLLVTCTLVAADVVALFASPPITPVTLVKLKLKLSALAETGARHVTATAATDVSAKSFDFDSHPSMRPRGSNEPCARQSRQTQLNS
jgi:hypothetical protein